MAGHLWMINRLRSVSDFPIRIIHRLSRIVNCVARALLCCYATVVSRATVTTTTRTPRMTLEENCLFGEYRLRELISQGGIASIWLATDKSGASFAIRVLHDTFSLTSTGPRLFRNGCAALTVLPRHPNIIPYISHNKINGREYMLLEYVEGDNLRMLTLRSDPLLDELLSDLMLDMAAAIDHIHRHGWMHLDIKPENLIVSRAGHLMLCDFDTAVAIPNVPIRMDTKSGTPNYMPPEQLSGWPLDQRADIYSFGVTIYELLTHGKPFEGRTPQEMLQNQLDSRYKIRSVRQFNPAVPVALEEVILKCLAYLPERRYQSMSQVILGMNGALGVR